MAFLQTERSRLSILDEVGIRQLYKLLNSTVTGKRNSWILGHCPFGPWKHGGKDVNPSFGVKMGNDKKPKSIFKCMSCGSAGDLLDLVLDIEQLQKREHQPGYDLKNAVQLIAQSSDSIITTSGVPDYEEYVPPEDTVFPQYWLDSFKGALYFSDAIKYCESRGVTTSLMEELDLRYDPTRKRICFPYRNFSGDLVGLQGRAIDDNELRYFQYGYKGVRNAYPWMGEHIINLDDPVVLLEGPFDYAKVYQIYKNVLGSFTSGLSKTRMKRLLDAREIVTFYDYGKGGDAARELIEDYYTKATVVHIIPKKEEDDAGSMSLEAIHDYLNEYLYL